MYLRSHSKHPCCFSLRIPARNQNTLEKISSYKPSNCTLFYTAMDFTDTHKQYRYRNIDTDKQYRYRYIEVGKQHVPVHKGLLSSVKCYVSKIVPVKARTASGGSRCTAPLILNLRLNGEEWLTLRPGRFVLPPTPPRTNPVNPWVGEWEGPIHCGDDKILLHLPGFKSRIF